MQTNVSKVATILVFTALATACGGAATDGSSATGQDIGSAGGPVIQADHAIQVTAGLQDRIRLTYANLTQADLNAHTQTLSPNGIYAAFGLSTGATSTSFGRRVDAFIPVMSGVHAVGEAPIFYVVLQPSTNNHVQTIAGPFAPAALPINNLGAMSRRTQLLQSAFDAAQRMAQEQGTVWPTKDVELVNFAQTVQPDATTLLQETLDASRSIDSGALSTLWVTKISQTLQKTNELVQQN